MKTHLVLFLCLSVLLSGCITANTAIFKPEPGSNGDALFRMWGGFWDLAFCIVTGTALGSLIYNTTKEPGPSHGMQGLSNLQHHLFLVVAGALAGLWVSIGLIYADVAWRDSLPYRKAYYQDKEAEEETTEPEEGPSAIVE